MTDADRRILVCNCEGTMPLDEKALGAQVEGLGPVSNHLCRAQIETFTDAYNKGGRLIVACTQEAPYFLEHAAELTADTQLGFCNIREYAGWSADAGGATPKIAALLAEAMLDAEPTPALTIESAGRVLVYGAGQATLDAALQLAGSVAVTCVLMPGADVLPPASTNFPLIGGTVKQAAGRFGAFTVTVDDWAPVNPSSRASLSFDAGRGSVTLEADIVLDLTGGTPLFPHSERRDGYYRPDPGDPVLVQRTLFDIVGMVGEFEKPIYVRYDEALCAHARNETVACSNCLDACPAGAIQPNGDGVRIDPHLCGGCGLCSSVCPSGAATYDLPRGNFLYERLRALTRGWRDAGGRTATLLVHSATGGREMVDAMARGGRGLPGHVIPFPVNDVGQFGLDHLLCAFAYGIGRVAYLVEPRRQEEIEPLAGVIDLANAILDGLGYGAGLAATIVEADPDAVEAALWDAAPPAAIDPGSFMVMGGKRLALSMALGHLHKQAPAPADILPLPAGAPFGTVEVDVDGCTLCLACVGVCPPGALRDGEDAPRLGFVEDACIQCGLCRATCPENVIEITPRLNFTDDRRRTRIIKEEDPFACIKCGKEFGTKASIEKVIASLVGHHMFQDEASLARLKMCDDCRVIDQFEDADQPMAAGTRRPTTTDDYLTGDATDDPEDPKLH